MSEEAEQLLSERLDVVNERVGEAVAEEDFQGACRTFATLRQPVDRFFDEVTVNVAGDEPLRQNRLRLLDKVRVSFLKLADFSQIEG